MTTTLGVTVRQPAVAGTFYPREPERLAALVDALLATARQHHPVPADVDHPLGILVPHAGLPYSGVVAAAGWAAGTMSLLDARASAPVGPPESVTPPTVVVLGTNHRAEWLEGLGIWDVGTWATPLGDVAVDESLATEIAGLGRPFTIDRDAHDGEHSIEVQLPFLRRLVPRARIVPIAVAAGAGQVAIDAGAHLGAILRARRARGEAILLAISTDMAHYPSHEVTMRTTAFLRAPIVDVDPVALATAEASTRRVAAQGMACGMCGIEPAIAGLAALDALGARRGVPLAAQTSADAGGPRDRTVGYLAVAFG